MRLRFTTRSWRPVAATLLLCACACAGAAGEFTAPFHVYRDCNSPDNHGAPSGWMGDYRDLRADLDWKDNPHTGTSCIRFEYTAEGSRYADMAGVMWQNPANNSGYIDGGVNLTGARRLVFWARGEKGGEVIDTFLLGGTLGGYPDTDKASLDGVMLGTEWARYEIDVSGCDLSYISGFFGWVAARYSNPEGFVMYLDDILLE